MAFNYRFYILESLMRLFLLCEGVDIMAYDTGVRSYMQSKGYDDSKINYDPNTGWVKYNNVNYVRPSRNYQGSTYEERGVLDQADKNYQNNSRINAMNASPVLAGAQIGMGASAQPSYTTPHPTTTTQPTTTPQPSYAQSISNPYDQQYGDLLGALMKQAQNPTAVDINSIYASPQYAAMQAQQQRAAQQGIRGAQESMGASGFGRSTALGERAQGIQNQANEYMQTQALPQLIAQEQQRQQQEYQNKLGMLGQLASQQGLYDTRYNNANDLALKQGELTGNYSNPNSDAIRKLMEINSGKYATATPDEQRRLHDENVRLAGTIGGRDTTGSGDYEFAPQRTLQGQQVDRKNFESDRDYEMAKGQQEWENNFKQGQLDWNKAQQAWENAFKEKDFSQNMQEAAAARGLQWASLSQRDKEFVADQAFREKQFEFEQGKSGAKSKNYEDNPEFAQDVADPETADLLVSNPQAYIDAYGTKGYLELRKIFKI